MEIIAKPRNGTNAPSSNGHISSKAVGARSKDMGYTNGGYVSEKPGHTLFVNGSGPTEEKQNGEVVTSLSKENEITSIVPETTIEDITKAEENTVKATPRKRGKRTIS